MPGPTTRRTQLVDEPNRKSQVSFEEPPGRPTKYDWHKIAAQLQRKPGKWAKVFDLDRVSFANAIRQGSVNVLHRDLGYEVRTANNTVIPGQVRMCTLYLRYNPDKEG